MVTNYNSASSEIMNRQPGATGHQPPHFPVTWIVTIGCKVQRGAGGGAEDEAARTGLVRTAVVLS